MHLGENRNVTVYDVFEGEPDQFGIRHLCGTVTYDQDNGVPIRSRTPFIVSADSDFPYVWITPPDGYQQGWIVLSCGWYDRQSGRWTPHS